MLSLRSMTSQAARMTLAAFALLVIGVTIADARGGRGSSFGSRGAKTWTAPPATRTAPKAVQPVQRSMTKPGQAAPNAAAPTAGVAGRAASQSRFAGGFGTMLMGGLIGAGLFGLLSGHGLFGGMTGLASVLGLLLQVGLIAGAIWLLMSFFRGRQPAMAGSGSGSGSGAASGTGRAPDMMARSAANAGSSVPQAGGGPRGFAPPATLAIEPSDFDAFERLLSEMQDAYSREDLAGLRRITTPEMVSYLSEEITENAKNGVRNAISGTRLLSGDLAEAWREHDAEYATVAMRFELFDTMVDRSSGQVMSGHPDIAQEATEVWTFKRQPGSGAEGWQLSAIQQA